MGKNISKNIRKDLSGKCSQKFIDHANQSIEDALKTAAERIIQKKKKKKIAGAIGYLVGNAIADRITEVSKTSQHENLEIVTNEHDKEISKERYIFPKERQKIIHFLRLI